MNSSAPSLLRDRKWVAAFFVLVLAALLVGNARTPVWDQDEAAYAGFAQRMLARGQWAVPDFPYSQPHRKVPLTFWLIAGSYAVFGVNEFALRLPSVLGVAVTLGAVGWGARFLVGAGLARLGALLVASMPFVLTLGKIALTDAVLLAFETIAALALLRGVVRPSWKATVTLWLAVAGGLLTKGPPILILVGGMFLCVLVLGPRRRNLVHLHPWFGLPLALVPLAIWVWLAWQTDPRFVLFLGYWYVLRRMGGSVFGQAGWPGAYFVLFLVSLVPWTGYFLAGLADVWRGVRRRRPALRLIASWLIGGWLIWELPWSKLPTYTLGAVPALALLLARQVHLNVAGRKTWATHRSLRAGFRILLGVCVGLGLAVLGLGVWLAAPWAKALTVLPAGAIVAVGWLGLRFQRRGQARAAVRVLLLGSVGAHLLAWLIVVPGIAEQRAAPQRLAQMLAEQCVSETSVYAVKRMTLPSVPFYVAQAGLRFQELESRDERRAPLRVDWSLLAHGKLHALVQQIQAQSPAELPAEEDRQFRLGQTTALYRSGQPAAFILDEEQYAALRDDLPGARVIHLAGWAGDRFGTTTYVLVLSPAALKPSHTTQPLR